MRKENGEEMESANRPQIIFTVKCEKELKSGDILVKSK
jgi:putative protease